MKHLADIVAHAGVSCPKPMPEGSPCGGRLYCIGSMAHELPDEVQCVSCQKLYTIGLMPYPLGGSYELKMVLSPIGKTCGD